MNIVCIVIFLFCACELSHVSSFRALRFDLSLDHIKNENTQRRYSNKYYLFLTNIATFAANNNFLDHLDIICLLCAFLDNFFLSCLEKRKEKKIQTIKCNESAYHFIPLVI